MAVSTKTRLPQFADVPTVNESGLPGFEFNSWFTLMAPAGTPAEIVNRLHAEVQKALADPEVREKLLANGLTPRGIGPQELATATRDQLARYARLFKQANIKAD
jgi:tripartite-type tricarboxylate transporter receptor subunit TctC